MNATHAPSTVLTFIHELTHARNIMGPARTTDVKKPGGKSAAYGVESTQNLPDAQKTKNAQVRLSRRPSAGEL
jgi:hypothetical protein